MATPAFQFYVGDWRKNAKLRRCTEAARGAWIDVMCLMHDSDEYGVLRWPLREIARAAGVPPRLLKELADKGVLKGADKNPDDYTWAPKHAGSTGASVVLVRGGDGPCWYCSRFVRDAEIRRRRGRDSQFQRGSEDDSHDPPNRGNGGSPKRTPKGGIGDANGGGFGGGSKGRSGDGPSSSSSSSNSVGSSSASVSVEEGARALDALDLDPDAAADAMGRAIQAATALRRMGVRGAHMAQPALVQLVADGATDAQLALTAAELALKKSGLLNDHDTHPDLLELVASAASAQQMGLSPSKYSALRAAMPNIGYVCSTLAGRVADGAITLGGNHGHRGSGPAGTAAGGRAQGSAAGRAEAASRAGDARDVEDDPGY